MKQILFTSIFLLSLLPAVLLAQANAKLARQYFDNGEYEKAAQLYQQLSSKNGNSNYYFDQYIRTLLALEDYSSCERALKKRLKALPKALNLYVSYGNVLEKQSKTKAAENQFEKAIKLLQAEQPQVIRLANSFNNLTKYEYAARVYEKGNKLFKNKNMFAYELGEVYKRKGDTKKMIENYLNSLELTPTRMTNVQAFFMRYLGGDDFSELQQQLFTRIQKDPQSIVFPEMLTWVYVQGKDFENALRQSKALDRRFKENGGRVYKLARTALREEDYPAAVEAFDYIIDQKGKTCPYYLDAKRELLNAKRTMLVKGFDYTTEDLRELEGEYEKFLDEFGFNPNSAYIIMELADLEALYLNDLKKAIFLLNDLIEMPSNDRNQKELELKSKAKLQLGDFYLMNGDVWESTLLYSQVDKSLKDAPLGEMARFKNAKLSYFQGDFEWAQGQLEVLKASTSELISNDAIDLNVFIMEHYSLDTTAAPMRMFARADLLNFQNKFKESFVVMDSISQMYPENGLKDDIYYIKSDIHIKKKDYQVAINYLEKIIAEFSDGILVDNALFRMAGLYENQLNDKEKAKELYEKILLDHTGSTFAVESRKRFRILRGDNLDGVQ